MIRRLALAALLAAACASTPPEAVTPVTAPRRPPSKGELEASDAIREVVVGGLCMTSAAGRPAVVPWFVRQLGWSDDRDEVIAPIARGAVRQFTVLAFDGRTVGLFSAIGVADTGSQRVAAGGYGGAPPCATLVAPGQPAALDPSCSRIQGDCGVAVAEVVRRGQAPVGEDPEPLELERGGACVAGADLVVDIDGDGRSERFPVAGFLDDALGPADEVVAVDHGETASCAPRFSLAEIVPPRDPRGFLGLDVLAVIDSDGDGRKELVLQLRYAGRRTAVLFAARESALRLERAGESIIEPSPPSPPSPRSR